MKAFGLLKDTAAYSLSAILSRGIAFFLLPFYTRIFSPSDFGIIDFINLMITMIVIVASLQLDQALARFYIDARHPNTKKAYFSTGLVHYAIVFGSLMGLGILFCIPLAKNIHAAAPLHWVIITASLSLFGEALGGYFLNQLKWQFQPLKYAAYTLIKLILTIASTLVLSGFLRWGIIGVFAGLCIGSFSVLPLGFYWSRQSFSPRYISKKRWKILAKFGSPLVVTSLALFAMQSVDRLFIKELLGLHEMGLYGLGSKLSMISLLVFGGFQVAFGPYVYKMYRSPDAKAQFSKVFKYVTFFSMAILLGITLFSPELLMLMATPAFYPAYEVVFFLVLSSMFFRTSSEFSMGIGIAKKNHLLIRIYIGGFLLNVALCYPMITWLGIEGAALATASTFVCISIASLKLSQKYFPINFAVGKLSILLAYIGLCYLIFRYGMNLNISTFIVIGKLIMVVGFVGLSAKLKFIETWPKF